ncbi:MAG: HU family DNA-binding protein [Minisyncoccia bacterium]
MGREYKSALDREIAARTQIRVRKVATILNAYYELMREELAKYGVFRIPGVGTLSVHAVLRPQPTTLVQFSGKKISGIKKNHVKVSFRKAIALKTALKEYSDGQAQKD